MARNYNPRSGSSDSADFGRRAVRKSADGRGDGLRDGRDPRSDPRDGRDGDLRSDGRGDRAGLRGGSGLRNDPRGGRSGGRDPRDGRGGSGDAADLRSGRVASQRKLNDSRHAPTAAGRSASAAGQKKPDDLRYPPTAAGRSASASRTSTAARRRQQQRVQDQYGRQKIEYLQVAQTDMAQSQQYDPRLRYSSFRHDRSQKVLDEQGQSRFADIHRTDGQAGAAGSTGAGGRGGAGEASDRAERRSARSSGTTVQEYRRQKRQQQAAARRANVNSAGRRLFARVLMALLGLAVLTGGGFALYHSPAFTIDQIVVEGNQYLSDEQVIALAAIPDNSTLLRVNTNIVVDNIIQDIWVTEVNVQRSFPSTLRIVVGERQVAAVVEITSTSLNTPDQEWLLSTDGIWLAQYHRPTASDQAAGADGQQAGEQADDQGGGAAGQADAQADGQADGAGQQSDAQAEDAEQADGTVQAAEGDGQGDAASPQFGPDAREPRPPGFEQTTRLTEVSRAVKPVVGESVSDEGLSNALAIINGLSAELRSQLQHISAPNRVGTTLTLTNNVSIAFGAAEDISAKEQVIKALLAEHQGKITHINVRVPDRATYRAAN